MGTKKDNTVMFSSRTRLYTNFNIGEHREEYVILASKEVIRDVVSSIKTDLNEESFVESILSGADTYRLGFSTNARSSYIVKPVTLGGDYVKYLLNLFCSPFNYFKEIKLIEDLDGSLAADLRAEFSVPLDLADSLILDENSVEITFNRLKALYNTGIAAKHILFKRLQKALAHRPGILINDICDIYDVEHTLEGDSKRILKIVRPLKKSEGAKKEIWRSSLKSFLA